MEHWLCRASAPRWCPARHVEPQKRPQQLAIREGRMRQECGPGGLIATHRDVGESHADVSHHGSPHADGSVAARCDALCCCDGDAHSQLHQPAFLLSFKLLPRLVVSGATERASFGVFPPSAAKQQGAPGRGIVAPSLITHDIAPEAGLSSSINRPEHQTRTSCNHRQCEWATLEGFPRVRGLTWHGGSHSIFLERSRAQGVSPCRGPLPRTSTSGTAMSAEAFARRAALIGVLHFLVACLVPTLPPASVGYHRALVGAHVNSVALAALQARGAVSRRQQYRPFRSRSRSRRPCLQPPCLPVHLQMCVGLAAPLMGLSPGLLSMLEVLLAVGTTAGGAGYIVGGVTGSMRCAAARPCTVLREEGSRQAGTWQLGLSGASRHGRLPTPLTALAAIPCHLVWRRRHPLPAAP